MNSDFEKIYVVYDKEKRQFLNSFTGFTDCTYHDRWRNMMVRVYGGYESNSNTYDHVECSDGFLNFFTFKKWCEKEPYSNYAVDGRPYHLDKDLLGLGKLYSEDTCAFLPQWLNCSIPSVNTNIDKNSMYVSLKRVTSKRTSYTAYLKTKDGYGKFVNGFDDPVTANKFSIFVKAEVMKHVGSRVSNLVKDEVVDTLLNFDKWLKCVGYNYDSSFTHKKLDSVLEWYMGYYDSIIDSAITNTVSKPHTEYCKACEESKTKMEHMRNILIEVKD